MWRRRAPDPEVEAAFLDELAPVQDAERALRALRRRR